MAAQQTESQHRVGHKGRPYLETRALSDKSAEPDPPALFFRDANQVLTLAGRPVPRRGRDLADLGIMPDGSVLLAGAVIAAVGRARDLQAQARRLQAKVIDCRGRVAMPGFVDSHTHLVFAGSRVEDYERRLAGATYEEIARAGGGIAYTARLVAEATPHALETQARRFLREFATHGTTTVEIKTGYGLDIESEIKMLRVIRALGREPGRQGPSKVGIVPTLLAAHALPASEPWRA